MVIKPTARCFLSALACLACFPAASQAGAEQQGLEIVQNGRVVVAKEAPDRIKAYTLSHGPFELRVSRIVQGGIKKNLGNALFEICASKESSIFDGIAVGSSVGAMPCLNGAAIMARAQAEPKEAVELMLSKATGTMPSTSPMRRRHRRRRSSRSGGSPTSSWSARGALS
jgi:hypothetical protein